MADITITFRDGEKRKFEHQGRSGGSYTKSVRYEAGVVIVQDEWGKETAFPLDTVKEVESRPLRY